MLLADMTDDQRAAVTALWQAWLPEGAELLELVDVLWSGWECDHNAALIREAIGRAPDVPPDPGDDMPEEP